MTPFSMRQGTFHAEGVPLNEIAEQYGTPCFVYSKAAIVDRWQQLDKGFAQHPHKIYYAVKANSNLAVLNLLARLGCGFDIVSAGEFQRVLKAGGSTENMVFSGVAKSEYELQLVISHNIHSINVESLAELERINKVATKLNKVAAVSIRVNPDVDAATHPYISTGLEQAKFGLPIDFAKEAIHQTANLSHVELIGIACHIGSQITELAPFSAALDRMLVLLQELTVEGIQIRQLDLGGGLGIGYSDEHIPSVQQYADSYVNLLKKRNVDIPIAIEPGRYLVGEAGILITRVEYIKCNASKNFAIVDAGMNDLLRPSLYQAHHKITAVKQSTADNNLVYDVVGPVCESADVLGSKRELEISQDDLLAVHDVGAYSFSMASNYNSRPRAVELMVDGDQCHLIRKRECFEDLIRGECPLPSKRISTS